ncbi:hypothetical protein CAJAP_02159 [Camponotus japonicus]
MFKIIATSCLMVTIAISLKKVDGQYIYKPALMQKESVINSPIKTLEHIQVGLENSVTGYIKNFEDVKATCGKLYHDVENATQRLLSTFKSSCLKETNETSVIESDIQKLTDMANDLKKNILEYVHEISTTCLKTPYNITSCSSTVKKNLAKIDLSELSDIALSYILNIYPLRFVVPLIPNIVHCYKDLAHEFTLQYLTGIYHDLTNCTQSIQHLLGA